MKTIKNIAEKYLIMLFMITYLFTSVSSMFFVPKRNLSVYANKQIERFGRISSISNLTSLDNGAKSNLPLFQHAFKSITDKKRDSTNFLLLAVALASMAFGGALAALKNGRRYAVNAVYIPTQAPYLSFCSLRL